MEPSFTWTGFYAGANAGYGYGYGYGHGLRAQYLYLDLGKYMTIDKPTGDIISRITARPDVTLNTVCATVNYKV
ncbi:hypothetical protein ACMDCR_25035 [Labrys okinawensis]|uniref:hypothetical protein n=1 Tax=Labrys okinawensis TaxID=346911 RepID=UPI0039BD30DA